jgi:geranylgeranyl diphosphate synthase type I
VRPALLIQGAALFDPSVLKEPFIVDAAAAFELFHSYLLIHDDIMDNDDLRRGDMSVHAALANDIGDQDAGLSLGILAGDLAAALAGMLFASMDAAIERHQKASKIFADMHLDVVHGQTLDILGNSSAEDVATHKTASYTTIGPLTIGAALGGATDLEIKHLAELARPLGVAFQFSDDLLGTFGATDVTGKPTGKDLKAGKKTVLLEEGLKRADKSQRAAINKVLGREDAGDEEIESAKSALIECGAKDACKTLIRDLVGTFRDGLREASYASEGTQFLLDLASFIETRDK